MTARALCLIALAGCSESGSRPDAPLPPDVGELQCGSNGAAVLSGSVGGQTIDPIAHVQQGKLNGLVRGVLIEDTGSGCTTSLMHDALEILTCSSNLAPGVTELGAPIGDCPTEQSPGSATFLMTSTMSSFSAVSGTLTIDSIDDTCMKGSFVTDWVNGQHITGVFAALVCP